MGCGSVVEVSDFGGGRGLVIVGAMDCGIGFGDGAVAAVGLWQRWWWGCGDAVRPRNIF